MIAPVLSVIVCTWNRAGILSECLDALRRQTLDPGRFEVIVVDNNSTDGTGDVVRQAADGSPVNIRYVVEEKQGLSVARNRGVEVAKGMWLAFIDDDSVAEPDLVAKLANCFEDTEAELIAGKVICVPPNDIQSDIPRRFLETVKFSELDFGSSRRALQPWEYPVGANFVRY